MINSYQSAPLLEDPACSANVVKLLTGSRIFSAKTSMETIKVMIKHIIETAEVWN